MDVDAGLRAAELGEAEFMYAMFACAERDSRAALGMAQRRVGGGEVTVMANDPTGGYWSRAIGLGVVEPLTARVVDEVLAFTSDHGGRSMVFQVAPRARPPGWADLLADRGAEPGGTWVKFAGDLRARPDVATDLKVDVLGAEHRAQFARVMCAGFQMPLASPLPRWFAGLPGWTDAGFTAYGAWDVERLVATACLFVHGRTATLAGAATLPSHRGRGAQSALVVRRIRDAAAAGCTVVTGETGAETPDSPNPSLHNLRRLGLVELYERRNWVWRAPPDSA